MVDHLTLDDRRIDRLISGILEVVSLKDAVGEKFDLKSLLNGLKVGRMQVPIGIMSVIPDIRHDKGVCHTYVDEFAGINMAKEICYSTKVQRPGVCNTMETLLVHSGIAQDFLPGMKAFYDKAGV